MAFHSTIQELIDSVNDEQMSYRKLHTNAYIRNVDNTIIKVPYHSILRDYRDYFYDIIIDAPLTNDEKVKYRFKPKLLSFDLYQTPELWFALMDINNIISVIDFNLEKEIKVFVPQDLRRKINEIMILEGLIK